MRPAVRIMAAIVVSVLSSLPAGGAAALDTKARERIHVELERGEIEAARKTLADSEADPAERAFFEGLTHFYAGDYKAGTQRIEQSIAQAPRSPRLQGRRQILGWVRAARDTTAQFVRVASPDGRYVITHAPGPDAVLVPYAMDALQRADRAVSKHLATRAPGPIRLEIYPSPQSLAAVSSLTVEHIQTSGTVALCKWNRLMIATPRSLLRGYPWLDTVTHELVHLLLTRASGNRAPVWFHEGTAKLLERSWRGETPGAGLSPTSEFLLVNAARNNKLMPFDQLHPSIAMLPSQEQAALAFAQVATFLERFYRQHGDAGLQEAVTRVAQGQDVREAIAAVTGTTFIKAERAWRAVLAERPLPKGPVLSPLKRRFKVEGAEADESLDVAEKRARRHMRLGDLLWGRGRRTAAAREYDRAQRHAPGDPIVTSRLARASLAAGQPEQAVGALKQATTDHPDYAPLQALLGAALVAQGKLQEAVAPLREALRINPFDPAPHCDLARAATDKAERARERKACQQLGGSPPPVHTRIAH